MLYSSIFLVHVRIVLSYSYSETWTGRSSQLFSTFVADSEASLNCLSHQSINQCYIPTATQTFLEIVHASCCSCCADGYLCSRSTCISISSPDKGGSWVHGDFRRRCADQNFRRTCHVHPRRVINWLPTEESEL